MPKNRLQITFMEWQPLFYYVNVYCTRNIWEGEEGLGVYMLWYLPRLWTETENISDWAIS